MNFVEKQEKLLETWKELDKNDDSPEIVELAQQIRELTKTKNLEIDEMFTILKRQIEKQERLANPDKLYKDFVYLMVKQTTNSLEHWTKAMKDSKRVLRFWM